MQNLSRSNHHHKNCNNSVCFVGNNSAFSFTALQTLLTQRINIRQIILPGYAPAAQPDRSLSTLPSSATKPTPARIQTLAAQHLIPVRYTGRDIQDFANWNDLPHHTPPEFLFVACFPFRLPATLCDWPTRLAINLHPSPLPAYRGPDPLFWQLRLGETNTGFSLHVLTNELDAGPILLQEPVTFPAGASRNELDTLLAQQGAEAFVTLLSEGAFSTTAFTTNEQNPQAASYHPPPQPQDYALHTDWSAQHAYNFIRGTHTPDNGYPILLDGQQCHVDTALSVEPERILGTNFLLLDEKILIQFSPGVLHAKPV